MRKMRHVLLILMFLPGVALAEKTGGDGTAWLQKIASAAHLINYSGTFVYRHDGYMETSRIVHISDASGEHEKLEVLDGPPREIVRNNDEVICYHAGKQGRGRGKAQSRRRVFRPFCPCSCRVLLKTTPSNWVAWSAWPDTIVRMSCWNRAMFIVMDTAFAPTAPAACCSRPAR